MFYFILWAVAVSISTVHLVESENAASHDDFELLERECTKEYGVGKSKMVAAVMAEDASMIDTCFWDCYFTKAGLLNDKGEYDINTYLSNFKWFGWGEERSIDRASAKRCESVLDEAPTDGENDCTRGALVAACFIKYVPTE